MATEGGRNILCILDFPVSMVLVRSRHSFQLIEVKFDLFLICPAKKKWINFTNLSVVWYFMFQSRNYYLPKYIQKIKAKTFTKCRFAI